MKDASTRPISARKHAAVLAAAKHSFMSLGFTATNLDEVARAAGVSKMTIYSHFDSKENLFTQVLEAVVAERSRRGPALDADVDASMLPQALTDIAIDLVETVEDQEIVQLRRILIAEQARYPLPAATWRRNTVLTAVNSLAQFFERLQQRRLLTDLDPLEAASQFLWMLIGDRLDAMLLDPRETLTSPRQHAAGVVRVFLAAHLGHPTSAGEDTQDRRRSSDRQLWLGEQSL